MLAKEIKIGGLYTAKISGVIVTVRVLEIITRTAGARPGRLSSTKKTHYRVKNLRTNRETEFGSAAKFRKLAILETPLTFEALEYGPKSDRLKSWARAKAIAITADDETKLNAWWQGIMCYASWNTKAELVNFIDWKIAEIQKLAD